MDFPTKDDHFGVFWGYHLLGNPHVSPASFSSSVGSTLFFFPLRRGGATGGQFQLAARRGVETRGTDLTRGQAGNEHG